MAKYVIWTLNAAKDIFKFIAVGTGIEWNRPEFNYIGTAQANGFVCDYFEWVGEFAG